MADEDVELVLSEAGDAMDRSLRSLRVELQKVRTGRANPSLLEGIQIDYYGTPTPLNQLANLTAPEPEWSQKDTAAKMICPSDILH